MLLASGKISLQICWSDAIYQGYRAIIEKDRVQLNRHGPGGAEAWGEAAYPFGRGEWHTVRLESDGTTVRLSIDGEEVLSGEESFPGSVWGTTMFGLASSGGEAYVDDILVER